jgi:hypothetical protein
MSEVKVQIEVEGLARTLMADVERSREAVLALVRPHLPVGEILLFERDKPEPFRFEDAHDRRAISLVAHRAHRVTVKVNFEHRTEHHDFAPSTTVNSVLRWAVRAFKLDDDQAAKANLVLPGAADPLGRDIAIGTLVEHGEHRPCELTLELTLRDFTNGER